MPTNSQHLFGPGSLEMLRLDLWVSKVERRDEGLIRQIKARLLGQYDVYCGNGNMHRIDIKTSDAVWDSEAGSYTADFVRARNGGAEPAERIAQFLLDCELEDWSDPCEEQEEFYDSP